MPTPARIIPSKIVPAEAMEPIREIREDVRKFVGDYERFDNAMQGKGAFVPYRDSKLTRLLKVSNGGREGGMGGGRAPLKSSAACQLTPRCAAPSPPRRTPSAATAAPS